jgi:flagellar biosynthetic protein FlhB
VARSRDLSHLLVVGLGGALLVLGLPRLADWAGRLLARGLRFDAQTLAASDAMTHQLGSLTWAWMAVLLPLGAIGILLAVGAALASGGWNFTWQPLLPNFGKLNPLAGLGRMVSGQHLGDLAKASLLALILGVVGGAWLWLHMGQFHDALTMPLPAALAHTGGALLDGLMLLCVVLAVFALVDVPLQRRMLANRLKMSHQEAKQEHKEAEGNIEVKGRIKARMREMARKRMLAAVPKADLVVMNPTHYAVALKYDEGRMAAPRVVAKGADLLALKIRDLAREHQVPVLQAAAAGAGAVCPHRGRPGDPGARCSRRGPGAGLCLPAARGHGRPGRHAATTCRPSACRPIWTPTPPSRRGPRPADESLA